MNQKYLMGMASEGVQTIVFAAAAPNVAAFIQQNKAAPELTVCTLDYKMLLTARMDRIDACPDRAFSVNELLPVIVQCRRVWYRMCHWLLCRVRVYRMRTAQPRIGIICIGPDTAMKNIKRSWMAAHCLNMTWVVKIFRWNCGSANIRREAGLPLSWCHGQGGSRRIGKRLLQTCVCRAKGSMLL